MLKSGTTLVLIALIGSLGVRAAEIDSFSGRYQQITDSMQQMNEYTNRLFQRAVNLANAKRNACAKRGRKKFFKELKKGFGKHWGKVKNDRKKGERLWVMRRYVMYKGPLERQIIKQRQSIYRDFKPHESIALGLVGRIASNLGTLIRFDVDADKQTREAKVALLIGSDKFSHFFNHGYRYFKRYQNGESVDEILNHGLKTERGLYGAKMTGVMSWADLAANFDGLRFWNEVLGEMKDPMTLQRPLPYIICENEHWKQVRVFDWNDYIDASWDEGQNCNQLRNQKLVDKVMFRIQELAVKDRQNVYKCPLNDQILESSRERFGQLADKLINTEGISVYKR